MKTFEDWFYQTEANEPDKPVLLFDRDLNTAMTLAELWVRMAYEAGSKQLQPIAEALGHCPDVSVNEVAEMIYARQRELQQEPEHE